MAWGNDLHMNSLSFDTTACVALLKSVYDIYLDDLSNELVRIVRDEINKNGNGSSSMRLNAMTEVRETRREVTADEIILEAGIDLAALTGREPVFVRVSVVLHGNQTSGKLFTKPGQQTWRKHVSWKATSTAKSVYPLPDGFNQTDKDAVIDAAVMANITTNASKRIDKHFGTFARNVNKALDMIDWSAFVKVS